MTRILPFGILLKSKTSNKCLVGFGFVLAITLNLLVFVPESFSSLGNKYLYDLDEQIYGKNYSEWSGQWWSLLQSFPNSNNPAIDTNGEKCKINQNDPNMFFLFGTTGNFITIERECSVPSSKAIFVPILASECNNLEDESLDTLQERKDCVYAGTKDGLVNFKLDGNPVTNLTNYYSEYSFNNISLIKDNIWGVDPGMATEYTGGYYLILKPLPPGEHTIEFTGNDPGVFTVDVKYRMNITNSTNQSIDG